MAFKYAELNSVSCTLKETCTLSDSGSQFPFSQIQNAGERTEQAKAGEQTAFTECQGALFAGTSGGES